MALPSISELFGLPFIAVSPIEYFTDSSNTINIKSDVVLVVGKDKFYCHRLLLSLVSPVFTRMFEGQFKEHDEREIVLQGKTSDSILELLKYIYPQFNGQIGDDNVEDFLQLADEYMIEHLKQPCKDVLVKQLEIFKFIVLPTHQKLEQVLSFISVLSVILFSLSHSLAIREIQRLSPRHSFSLFTSTERC
jgi:BTB/POZ domain